MKWWAHEHVCVTTMSSLQDALQDLLRWLHWWWWGSIGLEYVSYFKNNSLGCYGREPHDPAKSLILRCFLSIPTIRFTHSGEAVQNRDGGHLSDKSVAPNDSSEGTGSQDIW